MSTFEKQSESLRRTTALQEKRRTNMVLNQSPISQDRHSVIGPAPSYTRLNTETTTANTAYKNNRKSLFDTPTKTKVVVKNGRVSTRKIEEKKETGIVTDLDNGYKAAKKGISNWWWGQSEDPSAKSGKIDESFEGATSNISDQIARSEMEHKLITEEAQKRELEDKLKHMQDQK
jgi:hypothetical protein